MFTTGSRGNQEKSTMDQMHCDNEIRYDAFLAHSSKDTAIVEKVLQELENRGIKCCYSKRDFIPGHTLITFMQDSICKSWMTIAFFSKDFLESPHCEAERNLALQKAMEVRRQVLIPVLLDVKVTNLPLAIRGLTCLSMDTDNFIEKMLKALGVQDPVSRPTYSSLQQRIKNLEKEKCTMIQESLEYGCQISSQLVKKDDMIRKLQRQIVELEKSKFDAAKIASELDECKYQMTVMNKKLQEKEDTILNLKRENWKLKQFIAHDQSQRSVWETKLKLDALVKDEMDMEPEELKCFFSNLLLLLQTMTIFFSENTVIKKMHAAVLCWLGCMTGDWQNKLNYNTLALEVVHQLYRAQTPNRDTAGILNNIGVCHLHVQSCQAGIEYHTKALHMEKDLAGPSGMSGDLAVAYNNLGAAHLLMHGCTKEAIWNLMKAVVMYRKLDGDWDERRNACVSNFLSAQKVAKGTESVWTISMILFLFEGV